MELVHASSFAAKRTSDEELHQIVDGSLLPPVRRSSTYSGRVPLTLQNLKPLTRSKTTFTRGRRASLYHFEPSKKSQYDVSVFNTSRQDYFIQPNYTFPCVQTPTTPVPSRVSGDFSRKVEQAEAKKAPEDGERHGEAGADVNHPYPKSSGLTSAEAAALLAQHGPNCLEDKSTPKWLIFLRLLYQPMPVMIWIAIIVEAAIQNWTDMGILLGIQFGNAFLGYYETTKAGDAVAALKASLKPEATVRRDGKWQTIDASLLVPSDMVMLGSGSAVPADCSVNEGQIEVDQSALTGESLPVTLYANDLAKMGFCWCFRSVFASRPLPT